MIKRVLKSICIISAFTGAGAFFTLHAFTYWSLAIFNLSGSIFFLFCTILNIYLVFNHNKIGKLDKETKRNYIIRGIIFPLLTVGLIFSGKPYILDISDAISKKYVILRNAEFIKMDFHQGYGRGATFDTYYDMLVKKANGKQITLEVYTNFDIIRGKRTLTKYNISYLPHSKEIVLLSNIQ